jgi:hypothetical protein
MCRHIYTYGILHTTFGLGGAIQAARSTDLNSLGSPCDTRKDV